MKTQSKQLKQIVRELNNRNKKVSGLSKVPYAERLIKETLEPKKKKVVVY